MLPGHFSVGSPDEMRLFAHAVAAARVRRPQRQASITYSDEVPQVKVENRKTAAPFARERVRACQSVSVFYLHLFTRMPQNSDSQINRGEDFAQKPPHFAFFSGLFHRQSAVFQRFVPYHHKKWEIRSMSATAGTTARCAFFEQGICRRHNAQTFHSRRAAKHIFADRCSTQHGRRREFPPRNGLKQSSRCFFTGGHKSVNPNRQNLHTYQTMVQRFASYG